MIRRTGIAIVVTVAALLAGCASSGTTIHRRSHEPKSSSTTPVPTPTPSKEIASVDDLLPGWSVDHNARLATAYLPPCFATALATDKAESTASRAFRYGGQAPFFRETVAYFGASGAKAVFAAANRQLGHCRKQSFTGNKVKVTGRMSATSLQALGDESRAYIANLSIGGSPLTEYLYVIRSRRQLLGLTYQSPGYRVNPAVFIRLSTFALQRLTKS
jgi:hypothetical protein